MVAYSFKACFEEDIACLVKRQTVRSNRKRHARPGEALQLYVSMRTKQCRKILTPDPICIAVRNIDIAIDLMSPQLIQAIEIEGIALNGDEIEAFAIADGFGSKMADGFARRRMGQFWCQNYYWPRFSGVVIGWDPR